MTRNRNVLEHRRWLTWLANGTVMMITACASGSRQCADDGHEASEAVDVQGNVVVSCFDGFPKQLLMRWAEEFERQHPGAKIQISGTPGGLNLAPPFGFGEDLVATTNADLKAAATKQVALPSK